MDMGFLSSTDPQDEDDDLGADVRDPVARLTAAAFGVTLIRPGDKLDRNVVDGAWHSRRRDRDLHPRRVGRIAGRRHREARAARRALRAESQFSR